MADVEKIINLIAKNPSNLPKIRKELKKLSEVEFGKGFHAGESHIKSSPLWIGVK